MHPVCFVITDGKNVISKHNLGVNFIPRKGDIINFQPEFSGDNIKGSVIGVELFYSEYQHIIGGRPIKKEIMYHKISTQVNKDLNLRDGC